MWERVVVAFQMGPRAGSARARESALLALLDDLEALLGTGRLTLLRMRCRS